MPQCEGRNRRTHEKTGRKEMFEKGAPGVKNLERILGVGEKVRGRPGPPGTAVGGK